MARLPVAAGSHVVIDLKVQLIFQPHHSVSSKVTRAAFADRRNPWQQHQRLTRRSLEAEENSVVKGYFPSIETRATEKGNGHQGVGLSIRALVQRLPNASSL